MSNYKKQHMPVNWDSLIESDSQKKALDATLHDKAVLAGKIGLMMLSVGAGIGFSIRKKMIENQITLYANVAVSVALACLIYIGLEELFHHGLKIFDDHHEGYICAMLFIIPGFPLITGGIDLAKLDIRSGMERIAYSALIVIVAAFTAGLLASATKRFTGFPRITITVPSIIIMVPGILMYKGIYYIGLENYAEGAFWLTKALFVICCLCLGLIFARIITDKKYRTVN